MSHYDEQREDDYAERLGRAQKLKKQSAEIEWDHLEEIEQVNQGNPQLKAIRSRFSQRSINVMGAVSPYIGQ